MSDDDLPLRTTHISDAADTLGLTGIGAGGFEFLGSPQGFALGKAYTVQQRAVTVEPGQSAPQTRHGEAASSLAAPGDILVIQVTGDTGGATWGEALALRAMGQGLAGVVIDGRTRDRDPLRQRGFPVLCRASSPLRSAGRMTTIAVEVNLVIGGVTIRCGDTIAMDADGFVCIPTEHVETVMNAAQEIARREQRRDQDLEARLAAR